MKKLFILFACVVGVTGRAQDDIDALRYSQTTFFGDARFTAMGGSFGALGANLSCMHFNPAGIAVYRNGEFAFTPGLRVQTSKTTHYDSSNSDFSTKLSVSNLAFASAWEQRNPYPSNSKMYENWNQRHAFGISYNRIADFNFNTTISGSPDNSSIINDFVSQAQGVYISNLNPTYEGLAYQTYLINEESAQDTNHYWGMMLPNTPVQQERVIKTTGRMAELAFCYAHAFNDKVYAGATLGIPMLKFTRIMDYTELDYKAKIWPFHSLSYEEQLITTGTGYNLKAGIIYRVAESVRLGAYAHTPSLINLNDNYEYALTAIYDSSITSAGNTYKASYDGFFKYRLYTPARAGASVSYVYQRMLAVNADAEYISYGSARFKDEDNYLNPVNLTIQKKYKGTANVRVGAEVNLEPIILRGGYAVYGSPFGGLSGKFVRSSYTFGVGFKRKSNTYFDFGMSYTTWHEDYYLYHPSQVNPTDVKQSALYITGTLGIKFN